MVVAVEYYVTLVSIVATFDASLGSRYAVGDSVWSVPPYPEFYTNWSSSIVFYLGDSLVFDFEAEFYNVLQVPRLSYETCTSSNAEKFLTHSPAIIVLNEVGVFYYMCNISNYCELGQKISVIVHQQSPRSSPSPSPLPSSLPPLPTPPPILVPILAPEPPQSEDQKPTTSTIAPSPNVDGSSSGASNGFDQWNGLWMGLCLFLLGNLCGILIFMEQLLFQFL